MRDFEFGWDERTSEMLRSMRAQRDKAIRYLADSDACTRVQFKRNRKQCDRHFEADGCEACWREELGGEECTTDI